MRDYCSGFYTVIPDIEATTGIKVERIIADAGYKGHNAPADYKFKVYTQGQKRGVTPEIKRLFRRRAAVEPLIGHSKDEHRMGRNYLAHAQGDASNAVLAATGYNFRRLIRWVELLLRLIPACLRRPAPSAVRNREVTVDGVGPRGDRKGAVFGEGAFALILR